MMQNEWMKPAWQRVPIEDAGSQTIAKFDHMSSKPRHVWQGWFLSHEKNKFIFMDHPESGTLHFELQTGSRQGP